MDSSLRVFPSYRKHLAKVLLISFASAPVYCDEDELFSLSLEDLLNVKVTGASLREQNLLNIPASVNAFAAEGIARLGAQTLGDLIRFVPGFQSIRSDDSVGSSPASRGRLVGTSAREILLIVDSVRMENWDDGGSIYSLRRFPLMGVERVEFIRGPVSQLYGSNAFMGVINVITGSKKNKLRAASGNILNHQLMYDQNFSLGSSKHHLSIES